MLTFYFLTFKTSVALRSRFFILGFGKLCYISGEGDGHHMDSLIKILGIPLATDWTEAVALIAAIIGLIVAWRSLHKDIKKNAGEIKDLKDVVSGLNTTNSTLSMSLQVAAEQTVVMNASLDALNQILAGSQESQMLARNAHLIQIRPRFVLSPNSIWQFSGQKWSLELLNIGDDAFGVSIQDLPSQVTADRNYTPNPLRQRVTQLSGSINSILTVPMSFKINYKDKEGNGYSQKIIYNQVQAFPPVIQEPELIT